MHRKALEFPEEIDEPLAFFKRVHKWEISRRITSQYL
jgi:hypothetical protein